MREDCDSLQIAGLQALSTIDWPGHLAAVLFLQGCPWACQYCHNFEILDPLLPGTVKWAVVADLLNRRRGLLDAVVFSGGEATRQPALLPAMRQVKRAGFKVGLHTAGAYPAAFRRLLDSGVVDWVGLDIKALPGDYQLLTGSGVAAGKAEQALRDLLAHSEVDYEVRLTLWNGGIDYALLVAQWCRDRGVEHFVLQRLSKQNLPSTFQGTVQDWRTEDAQRVLGQLGFSTVVVRE